MEASVTRQTRLIGTMLVEANLITCEQLEEALEVQARDGGLLGEIVVERFGVSRVAVAGLLAEQWAELDADGGGAPPARRAVTLHAAVMPNDAPARLGEIFVEMGLANEEQIEDALAEQRETGRRLGEILVATGTIGRGELADALGEHWTQMRKFRSPGSSEEDDLHLIVPTLRTESVPGDMVAGDPDGMLDELERRIDELEAAAADRLDEVHDALAGLADGEVATIREGLEHLSSGQAEALELLRAEDERLVDAIAAVAKSVEDLGGVAHLDPDTGTAVDRDALDAFRERIDRLESGNAWEDRIAAVVEDLEALRIRQEEIAAAGTDSSALERLEKRIEFIDAGLGEALEGRVSTERHQQDVDELMGLIEAHAVDPAALEELRAHLEEHAEAFGARIDEATARADEERSRLGDRAEQLADEIRSLSAEAARTSELSQLQEGLAALADEQASVEARLAEIAGQVETNRKAADRDEVVQLREALDALAQETRNHLDTLRHTHDEHAEAFGARIDEATARADEERSRLGDRAEQLADEIRSLSAEAARTSELSQLQEGLAALADEQASVEARLAEIAGQVETNRKAADRDEVVQLREALDALAQETRNHLDTLRHTHDEHAEAFGARIDEATARADEERSRLGDRAEQLADEIRSLSAEAARTSELSQLQEGLAALADEQASVEARLAEIAGQVETNRKAADRDEVVQLREALDALAQETRNHLDTLRHTHDEHAAANEDQTARVESLATDVSSVRNELQTSLEAIRTSNSADARAAEHRNYELEALVAALGPRLDDLDSRLTAASELAAAPSDGATKLVRELETTIEDLEGRLEARVNELAGRMGDEASAIASRLAGLDNCVQEQTATHERTAKELEALGYEMRKGAAASGEAIRRIDASVQAHAETAASLDHLRAVEATIGEVSSLLESLSRMRASDAAQNDERVHALEASFALFEDKLNEIETVTGTELDARRAEALAAEAALRRADDALARVDEIAAEIAAERLLHAAADDPEAPVADACVDKASKKKAKKRKHDGKAKKKRS